MCTQLRGDVVVPSKQAVREKFDELKTAIKAALEQVEDLALSNVFDERVMNEALDYLHGFDAPRTIQFDDINRGPWPRRRTVSQLRIICEVTGRLSEYVDKVRLHDLLSDIEMIESPRRRRRPID